MISLLSVARAKGELSVARAKGELAGDGTAQGL
jgi:hypothetical protein